MRREPSLLDPRVEFGNRRLGSKLDWVAMGLVLDAIEGDVPAVRKAARKLRRSGKGVEEAVAAVKDRQYAGRGPLHMAAWAGRLEMCRFLIKDLRLNIDALGDDGSTPLLYAVFGCGSTSVVRFLLDRGANPNTADTKGFTALHYATMTGTDTDEGEEDMNWEANTRDTCEIAELLLSRGAYVDPICERGTPLHVAAHSGNVRMVELLLRHQANQVDASLEENNGSAVKVQGDAAFESMVLKMQGDAAFEENAHADALALYTKAMEADPNDSTLYAKRSLCWVHLSEEDKAMDDANTYKAMEMDLSNSCYEQAASLMLTKEYAQACQALICGFKLDLRNDDLD